VAPLLVYVHIRCRKLVYKLNRVIRKFRHYVLYVTF